MEGILKADRRLSSRREMARTEVGSIVVHLLPGIRKFSENYLMVTHEGKILFALEAAQEGKPFLMGFIIV